jgi:hypothetical protein
MGGMYDDLECVTQLVHGVLVCAYLGVAHV